MIGLQLSCFTWVTKSLVYDFSHIFALVLSAWCYLPKLNNIKGLDDGEKCEQTLCITHFLSTKQSRGVCVLLGVSSVCVISTGLSSLLHSAVFKMLQVDSTVGGARRLCKHCKP